MKPEIKTQLGHKNIGQRITSDKSSMIAKIEAALVNGGIKYCENNGYQLILVPHLTKATGACENFSTLFSSDLFGKTAYLSQTGQLMLEAFMDRFEKTYCFGPSFRKEPLADERHLIEFPLFEIEVAGFDLNALKLEISNILSSMIGNAEEKCSQELYVLTGTDDLSQFKPPYNSVTYREALEILSDFNLDFGADLKAIHEDALVKRTGSRPLFITHYPQEIKFFNMKPNREDPSVVNSMDLLMPYSGESVGAAEREDNVISLKKRLENSEMLKLLKQAIRKEQNYATLKEHEMHAEALSRFEWYMSIVEKNPISHAGCGIGVNRVSQCILRLDDIRYSTAFPLNRDTLF